MTSSKYYSKVHGAHSSRMVWRVRAAESDERTAVQVSADAKRKSAKASKLEPSSKDVKNVRQGERSFKSVLLSNSTGANSEQVQAPRLQSHGNDCPSKSDCSDNSQEMHKDFSSMSGLEASLRARWSDLSDAMSDCSESAGPWDSSATDADTTSVPDSSTTASHKEGLSDTSSPDWTPASANRQWSQVSTVDGDAHSFPHSSDKGSDECTHCGSTCGSDDAYATVSGDALQLPTSAWEGSPEEAPRSGIPMGTLEGQECPESPFTYVAPDQCGVRTPDLQEEQEPYVYDPSEWEVGGAWCSWMPTFIPNFASPGELNVAVADGGWYPAVVPSQDQAQQGADASDGIVGDAFNAEATGDVTNDAQYDVSSSKSSSTYYAVTGWMPVVTMVEVGSTVEQLNVGSTEKSESAAAVEEDLSKDKFECFIPLDGTVPVTEDAITESLINWKLDSAWSQDECGHAASSSHLDWNTAFGEFDPSSGQFDPSSQGKCDWFPGCDPWCGDFAELDKYSRGHYVQAAKAFTNARNMRVTMFEDHFSATGEKLLDDGTATTASGVDASSSLDSQDFLRGLRAPVHSNVPRSRNFAQECRQDEEEEITTLMIRNIPNRYKRSTLMRELDSLGLTGTYDFLYIPVDRGTSWNVGYAFVNFLTAEFAADCIEKLHGHVFLQNKSSIAKVAQVSAAHMQGYERNVQYYKGCAVYSARECQRPLIVEESSRDLDDNRSRVIAQKRFL